jgi:hypothetical protein
MQTEESQPNRTENHSFDELAKGLASGNLSRRQALKLVGGALLGGLLVSIPGVAQAHHKPDHGTPPGQGGTPPGQGGIAPGQGACPPGLTLCAGLCYDLRTDPLNCGACGAQCGPGGTAPGIGRCCFNGVCYQPFEAPERAVCLCSGDLTCNEGLVCCPDNVCRESC